MDLRAIDLADDDALAAVYTVECAATAHARPRWVPLGEAARTLGWRADDGWERALLGAWDGDDLLGFAAAMTHRDTPDTTWIVAAVAPGDQGSGVGTALVRAAERAAPAVGNRFVASAYLPSHHDVAAFATRFAEPLGYVVATTETVVELDLDAADLPDLPASPAYVVSTHVGGVPEPLRAQVGQIKGLVDSEAPNGDLDWSASPVSPEEYAEEIDLWVAQGRTAIESVAVSEAGDVAAWTCLVAAADPQRPAQVEGTLVVREHRGHGLGAAVKTACHEVARSHGVARVVTSSDDENRWMRAINADLGFVPVESEVVVQRIRQPDVG